MPTAPGADNVATFYFNYARSAQSDRQMGRAVGLFSRVLGTDATHQRALDQRAACHASLQDLDSAVADLQELTGAHSAAVDQATRTGWTRRLAEAKRDLAQSPRALLGLAAFPSAAVGADDAAIKKAYRTACLQHHPDKHAALGDDARARAKHKFGRIQAAYEKLSGGGGAPRRGGFGGQSQYTRSDAWG